MAVVEFFLPDIGEGLAEVELVKWLVAVGERVEENQPIADVESDKAVVTMPAPASGTVIKLCVDEGERVKVGALMLVVDGETTAQGPGGSAHGAAAGPAAIANAPAEAAGTGNVAAVAAAPAARRLATERSIDLASVKGTGPRGRITVEDVERAAASGGTTARAGAPPGPPSAGATSVSAGPVESVPYRGIRRRIGEAMAEAYRSIPHVCGFHELDGEALVKVHAALKAKAGERGLKLTYLPFIVRAVARALKEHPYLNASLDEAGGQILLKKAYNIGIATAAPDGLMVPVLHDADRLDLAAIARGIDRLTQGARERTLAPADLRDGTFTITNVGAQRGWLNTSLIRPPEVAILGVGRIEPRAVVRDGQVVARAVLPIALTFDHRVIDGEQALDFMLKLRALLEHEAPLVADEPAW